MIAFRNLTKVYPPNTVALSEVNLEVKPGEFISVVGQSGTGKTTLVKMIIAEERPTRGQVVVGGWDITGISHREVPYLRRQIGVVFQDFKLLTGKTAGENIAFALETCGIAASRVDSIVPQLVRIVGLEGKERRYPHQLSGGEQQRVAIARALVHRPKLLVADEPTGNLDSLNTKEIVELLLKINQLGTTVMLVTHNREVVNGLRRRVVTLDHGVVVSDQENGRYVL